MMQLLPVRSGDLRREKVTGAKVYASDLAPTDLPASLGWRPECAHALLVRAACVNRRFKGLKLDRLGPRNAPAVVVTAEQLGTRGFVNQSGSNLGLWHLVPQDAIPQYLSQPLAILIFDDFLQFRRAAHELREDRGIVVYGDLEPVTHDPPLLEMLSAWRQLKAPAGAKKSHYLFSGDPQARSSQWVQGELSLKAGQLLRKAKPDVDPKPDPVTDAVHAALEDLGNYDNLVETLTLTQQVDPAFLEPESGLGALVDGRLTLVSGTQSAFTDLDEIKKAVGLGVQNPTTGVKSVDILSVDCGGGFGGRDKSPHAVQLAYAAAFSNRPVRLAYDRFEQFQAGVKRHASAVHSVIAATDNGTLTNAHVHFVLEGGIEPNLGVPVNQLAALHASGFYRFERAAAHGIVTNRPVPIVGSMRGFGIPQVLFNIETAIDKLAVLKLGVDPIQFRLQNVLRHNEAEGEADCDLAGTPMIFHVANAAVCEAALQHPLWTKRDALRDEARSAGLFRGVGFAGCMEAYGTSADSMYAGVELQLDGTVAVWSQAMDMGQGARRSLASIAERIFTVPASVANGELEPILRFAAALSALAPALKVGLSHSVSSASKTAFFHVHVLREACLALLRLRIFPAVRALLDRDLDDALLEDALRDGAFHIEGFDPVPLAAVANALGQGSERFAIAHGYFARGWSSAIFDDGGSSYNASIDSLGFAPDHEAPIALVPATITIPASAGPSGKKAPRSGYAAGGHLIAVEIDPRSHRISVTDAVAFIDAGDPIVPTALAGQVEGGFQMGLAHALFEELPPESGEDRFVNFDRYILPRASDLIHTKLEVVALPLPDSGALNEAQPNIRHKGVGEVTMTTVAPALANAIAHALGGSSERNWPTRLPIRFADLEWSDDA